MKVYQRDENRTSSHIKTDVEKTGRILREDVYDFLKSSKDAGNNRGKTKIELRKFVKELNGLDQYSKQHGNIDVVAERIINDMDSYNINWKSKNEKSTKDR